MADEDFANPLEALAGYNLRRASAALMADLERALDRLDLKPSEASILRLIDANPGITQSGLGRMLGIQRANMAPMAGALVERGLIDRERADGRSQRLGVTPAGAALALAARAAMEEHDAAILARLPAPLHAPFRDILAALRERPERHR